MAPIYTSTDSSSDKKKNVKCLTRYPSMRKMVSGRESVGKKYEGSEGVEFNKIKQQHSLLYSWGNLSSEGQWH